LPHEVALIAWDSAPARRLRCTRAGSGNGLRGI